MVDTSFSDVESVTSSEDESNRSGSDSDYDLSDPDAGIVGTGTVEPVSTCSQEGMDECFSSTNTYDLPSWDIDNASDASYQESDSEKSENASSISLSQSLAARDTLAEQVT